jgi:hypothetical protein
MGCNLLHRPEKVVRVVLKVSSVMGCVHGDRIPGEFAGAVVNAVGFGKEFGKSKERKRPTSMEER